jgi:hypothetical protein
MDEKNELINDIVKKSFDELNNIMNTWCKNYENEFSGGKMRNDRGEDVENFVKYVIQTISDQYKLNIQIIKGKNDKKKLTIKHKNKLIEKNHQVDLHIYKDDVFIAVIECKSYLDSCYYVRACDDFRLFKKFGYDVKKIIFALENSIDEKTKLFTDVMNDNICDNIFYLLDGKRISSKPIYNTKYKKNINEEKLFYFIKTMYNLLINI